MAGIGDSLFNLLQPDPEQAIGQWSDEQQRKNRAAIGLDANGNPLPAAAAAPAAAPAPGGGAAPDGGDQAAVAAQASSTLPPNQEPNATKTPVSLGHLMMNLQQRDEADQGLNQSLGGMFAAFAQPRDREWVSKIFNVDQPDPNKIGMTQMNLAGQQQGQDRMNALGAMVRGPQGADIARSLNITQADLIARYDADPQGVGNMIQSFRQPTDPLKNLQQLQTMGAGPGGTASPTMKDITSGVVSSVAGADNAPMIAAQAAWRTAHPGQPDSAMPWTPNDLRSFSQYSADEKAKSDDRQTASNELNDKNLGATTLQGDLEQLKTHPGLKTIMTTPGHSILAQNALNDPNATDVPSILAKYVGLSTPEANAIALLRRIKGATTESAMKSMAGTGSRVTQAEVAPLNDAINMTQNLNQGYDSYIHSAVAGAITRTKKVIASNYGNTGNVTNMDPEYAPWLDDSFKKGGQLYKEGSGVDALPAAKPIPPDLLASTKKEALDYPVGKDDLLDNLQQQGFDTRRLRKSDPGSW